MKRSPYSPRMKHAAAVVLAACLIGGGLVAPPAWAKGGGGAGGAGAGGAGAGGAGAGGAGAGGAGAGGAGGAGAGGAGAASGATGTAAAGHGLGPGRVNVGIVAPVSNRPAQISSHRPVAFAHMARPYHSHPASRGQLTAALGPLNAAHAAPEALAHASPRSMVGKIATYDRAMLAALSMPAQTPQQMALREQAITSARVTLAEDTGRTLTPAVVSRVDHLLGLPGYPMLGTVSPMPGLGPPIPIQQATLPPPGPVPVPPGPGPRGPGPIAGPAPAPLGPDPIVGPAPAPAPGPAVPAPPGPASL